ncbi:MAG: glycosyltransferase family 2 protein [Candidatus Aenigmarchaeota archaeon]|nr:glycosyltransferase family 2 protein [Candidatus Aenigmarchaeota archaeon]
MVMWETILAISILLSLGFLTWYMGWKWERGFSRPKSKGKPLVSIIIPAYKSEATIRDTLESVRGLNYKNTEIIVANDSQDGTPAICAEYGAKVIQHTHRAGKPKSLNEAVSMAKGEILFFLDADTTVDRDCLDCVIPWFSRKGIGAVSPRYTVKNGNKALTRLISFETMVVSSLFKTHMFFGSLITFRGCGVAVRRSVLEKLGGWPETLIEDNYFAAQLHKAGYTIQYDHEAVVRTMEPASLGGLKSQRIRWGKGFVYTFCDSWKAYFRAPQFSIYALPYLFLIFGVAGLVLWQTATFLLPLIPIYILYTFSLRQFFEVLAIGLAPLLAGMFTNINAASVSHVFLIAAPEHKMRLKEMALVIPYTFIYVPLVTAFYFRGIVAGINAKRKHRPELDFENWA